MTSIISNFKFEMIEVTPGAVSTIRISNLKSQI